MGTFFWWNFRSRRGCSAEAGVWSTRNGIHPRQPKIYFAAKSKSRKNFPRTGIICMRNDLVRMAYFPQKKFEDLKMAGEFLSDFVVKDPSLGCEFLAPTEVPKQRPGPLPTASASLDADLLFFQLPDGIFRRSDGWSSGFSLQNTSSPCILRWVVVSRTGTYAKVPK